MCSRCGDPELGNDEEIGADLILDYRSMARSSPIFWDFPQENHFHFSPK